MDQGLRTQFITDISLYNADTLIFIDEHETGCDRRNTIRKHGYGVRGKPVRCQKLLVRGERISVIVAMTVNGILDLQIVRGSVNGDVFMDFVERVLLPNLMPFNGTNPNSVVLLDNCSVHHVEGVVDTIQEMGTILHFLPPYSPDLTPIEFCFLRSKVSYKNGSRNEFPEWYRYNCISNFFMHYNSGTLRPDSSSSKDSPLY